MNLYDSLETIGDDLQEPRLHDAPTQRFEGKGFDFKTAFSTIGDDTSEPKFEGFKPAQPPTHHDPQSRENLTKAFYGTAQNKRGPAKYGEDDESGGGTSGARSSTGS